MGVHDASQLPLGLIFGIKGDSLGLESRLALAISRSQFVSLLRQGVIVVIEKGEALKYFVLENFRSLGFVCCTLRRVFLVYSLHLGEELLREGEDGGWRGEVQLVALMSIRQIHLLR